jgi:hypothetical protein
MRLLSAAILLCSLPLHAEALHSSLMPVPQHVEYGSGSIKLNDLEIVLPETSAAEDRFAAAELAAGLLKRTGITIPVKSATGAHKAILFQRSGGIDALPRVDEQTGPSSREAYKLSVGSGGVVISAVTSAGIFYGVQTLIQLAEPNAVFPFVTIEDWPGIAYRGTMIDMSEGPVATEDEVLRQLDFLASWKGNQYYFYNEDSIELTGYSLLNPQAQFSKNQIRHIIEYARQRHIDVVPCLELYGHQHDLFRIEKFTSLADFPHGGEFDPVNPAVQKILANWTAQYLELFPSQFVHIGFDETWEIERAARVKGSGSTPAKLFLKQLKTVAQPFIDQKKRVLAWGDIVVKFPGIADQIPPNVVIVPWWYEPDPDPLYKKWLTPLVANHVPLFIAPGVNMWTEMTPNFDVTFRNIATFLSAGKQAGATGMINTVWTDNQEGLRRMAWPGIAYGAIAAWQRDPIDKSLYFSAYSQIEYPGVAVADVADGLNQLSKAESLARDIWGVEDMDAQWNSPFEAKRLAELKKHRGDLSRLRICAEEAQSHFLAALSSGHGDDRLNTLLFGSRVLDFAGMRSLYAIEIAELWAKQRAALGKDAELWELLSGSFSRTHGRVGDIMDALSLLVPDYRTNWLAEYKPYRMETALLRWNMEYEFWWRAQRSFDSFQERYKKGTPPPALEDVIGK